jgi:hypothetical protein
MTRHKAIVATMSAQNAAAGARARAQATTKAPVSGGKPQAAALCRCPGGVHQGRQGGRAPGPVAVRDPRGRPVHRRRAHDRGGLGALRVIARDRVSIIDRVFY